MKSLLFTLGGLAVVLLLQTSSLDASSFGRVMWQLGDNNDEDGNGLFSSITTNPPLGKPLGKSLYDCSESTDILQIKEVELTPDPPHKGQTLYIKATGTFSEAVTQGSYAKVIVKYGLIQLIKQTYDLCENVSQANISCPIGPGEITLERSVDLPKEIPPGSYRVNAQIFTEDDRPITCLNAAIRFGF
ncbi:ML domain-containing protein [Syncephalis plumigaleata]|nr:ML domain-containing protein [Syncephalis plumigaleata]KAI8054721.1 ML domain-containing protein [Syncephalis plumigaleata]